MPADRPPIAAAVVLRSAPSPSAQDSEAVAARKVDRSPRQWGEELLWFISPPPATFLRDGEYLDAVLWTILAAQWRAKAVWGSRVIKQPDLR